MSDDILYETIFETIKREDEELANLTGKGIYYAPELYVAFMLGKEIKKNDIKIFGQSVEWLRETSFGDTGPSDFAFKTDKITYVFELKLRDKDSAYINDVKKLKKLDNNYVKYFLALVDSKASQKDKDPRIVSLKKEYPELKQISKIESFSTMQDWYKGDICCTVGLWNIP